MTDIHYFQINDLLPERVPELRTKYAAERAWWGEQQPGPHVIYGDVLTPYLLEHLQRSKNTALLHRVFDLLEELSRSDDERIKDVVGATILQRVMAEPHMMKEARKYMGQATAAIADQMEGWHPAQ